MVLGNFTGQQFNTCDLFGTCLHPSNFLPMQSRSKQIKFTLIPSFFSLIDSYFEKQRKMHIIHSDTEIGMQRWATKTYFLNNSSPRVGAATVIW